MARRGFKSEANWYARSMRQELGRHDAEPLCPWELSEHLGYPLRSITELDDAPTELVTYFRSSNGQRAFSAVTLFHGRKRLIVYNDAHGLKRQAADIAHELAHGLLLHPPKPPFNAEGSRHYDPELEEEANWLGPALLISDEAAVHIVEQQMSIAEASDLYGASHELVRMRINVSGARVRVARRRAA